MNIRRRWEFFSMPFKWLRRGCYDFEAHMVAWRFALRLPPIGGYK